MLHGLVFSAWVILFGIQASLVATNRVAVHRQLGKGGMVLIAIMIPLAILTALQGVDRPFSRPPGIPGLTWLAVPLLDVPVFGGLIVFFLIVEPHGLARLWSTAKEKMRLWPFPH